MLTELRVHKVCKVLKDYQVLMELLVYKDRQVQTALMELQAQRVLKAL